ncbi:hypothetical protein K3X04_14780, partial [Listeria monocytogenes]|nr:hypothetical protein [Listeria monocytogenes]
VYVDATIEELVERSRRAQGLPVKVEDVTVLARLLAEPLGLRKPQRLARAPGTTNPGQHPTRHAHMT